MTLIEEKEYNFALTINGKEQVFTKNGKLEVFNFLKAFRKSIDLEQVYKMLTEPQKEVEKQPKKEVTKEK